MSGLTCCHQSLSVAEKDSSDLDTELPFKCGLCELHFSAICVLHNHLKGGSYQFEAETMTAYPVDGTTCSEGNECFSEPESPETDMLEIIEPHSEMSHEIDSTIDKNIEKIQESSSKDGYENVEGIESEKLYKVYNVRRLKRKRSEESGVINVIKIVDQPTASMKLVAGSMHPEHNNLETEYAHEMGGETKIITYTETNKLIGGESGDANENMVIKTEVNDSEYIDNMVTYSELEKVKKEQNIEEINLQSLTSEVLVSGTDDHSENVIGAQTGEMVGNDQSKTGDLVADDADTCNIKLPSLYKALISATVENQTEIQSSTDIHITESDEGSTEIGENIDIQTVVDNISGASSGDKDLEQTVAAFDKLGEPQSHIKRVVVTLYGLETDADGSVQIVVGEEDAAVFNTAVGEEILKAIRAQAKDIPTNESTQIVFNYVEPQTSGVTPQDPNFIRYDDLSEEAVTILSDERPHITYFQAPKRPRRMYVDDSLPKFKIQLPKVDDQSDCASIDNNEIILNPDIIRPIVFKTVQEKLTFPEALNILTECSSGKHAELISKTQPILAKGGDLYVIDLEALPHRKDCRFDKYLWVNCVTRKFPSKNPVLNKHVFKIRLPNHLFSDAFQRHIYQFIKESRYCIIHYIGHEGVFQPLAHGNSKRGAVFNRTCPSVLKELKDLAMEDGMTANKLHKQIESLKVSADIKGFRTPRNLTQIKNTFRSARKTKAQQEHKE